MNNLNNYNKVINSSRTITDIKNILRYEEIYIPGYKYKKEIFNDKFILTPTSESFMYVNSFVPVVEIEFRTHLDAVLLLMNFKLTKTANIVYRLLLFIGVIFQISILMYWIKVKMDGVIVIFIPLLWIIMLLIMSHIGLVLSSKRVLKIIKQILE